MGVGGGAGLLGPGLLDSTTPVLKVLLAGREKLVVLE
jgi:hypothetical protein